MHAVEFDQVSKLFGPLRALSDVSFRIRRGSLVALLGPNGSGKTTTLRLLLNLFYPDAGDIRVLGQRPSRSVSDAIGYLPEERGLYRNMRVDEHLTYYARLKGKRGLEREQRRWLAMLDIERHERSLISNLSKGTAQKVQFIATVLHRPEFVILDEPFTGLDPLSREHLADAISELLKQGTTILLSTHDMSAAEELCDSYVMLFKGKKVLDGTREEVLHAHGSLTVRVRCSPNTITSWDLPGVTRHVTHGDFHTLELDGESDAQRLLQTLVERTQVQHFEVVEASLREIFLRLARD